MSSSSSAKSMCAMLYTRSVTACAHRMLNRTKCDPPHRSAMSGSRPRCCIAAKDGAETAEARTTHIQMNARSMAMTV